MTETPPNLRDQLVKLSSDLQHLARCEAKPVELVMVEARAKFDALGAGEQREPFNRITAIGEALTSRVQALSGYMFAVRKPDCTTERQATDRNSGNKHEGIPI